MFNEGDRVRIRDWADMADEFGVTSYGEINCSYYFVEDMGELCGLEAVIMSMNSSKGIILDATVFDDYWISEDMLEMAEEPSVKWGGM